MIGVALILKSCLQYFDILKHLSHSTYNNNLYRMYFILSTILHRLL